MDTRMSKRFLNKVGIEMLLVHFKTEEEASSSVLLQRLGALLTSKAQV